MIWAKLLSRWMHQHFLTPPLAAEVLGYADRSPIDRQLRGEAVPPITRADALAATMQLDVVDIRRAIIQHQEADGETESPSGNQIARRGSK